MNALKAISIAVSFITFLSCTPSNKNNKTKDTTTTKIESKKQLNITVLLDLSDRIDPIEHPSKPEQYQKDLEILNYITLLFKQNMERKGNFLARGKIKIIFSLGLENNKINKLADKLYVDLSKVNNAKKKEKIFDDILLDFKSNLTKIYAETIKTQNYIDADIWRFFKSDVVDYAINNKRNYRNVLIILTNGYLYNMDAEVKKENRTSFLVPNFIKAHGLRDPNWKENFNKGNYGYITKRKDLNNLDILVLEINPLPKYPSDGDVIKTYFTKWFTEMHVNHFKLYNTDLPINTKTEIENFLGGK